MDAGNDEKLFNQGAEEQLGENEQTFGEKISQAGDDLGDGIKNAKRELTDEDEDLI